MGGFCGALGSLFFVTMHSPDVFFDFPLFGHDYKSNKAGLVCRITTGRPVICYVCKQNIQDQGDPSFAVLKKSDGRLSARNVTQPVVVLCIEMGLWVVQHVNCSSVEEIDAFIDSSDDDCGLTGCGAAVSSGSDCHASTRAGDSVEVREPRVDP